MKGVDEGMKTMMNVEMNKLKETYEKETKLFYGNVVKRSRKRMKEKKFANPH